VINKLTKYALIANIILFLQIIEIWFFQNHEFALFICIR